MTFVDEFLKFAAANPAIAAAICTAFGAIAAAGLTIGVTKWLPGVRDKQDREVEWRKHAIELTKLDLDRRLKTRSPTDISRMRPSILDFLANYRDLSELGTKTPKELYQKIYSDRISRAPTTPDANSENGTSRQIAAAKPDAQPLDLPNIMASPQERPHRLFTGIQRKRGEDQAS